MPVSFCNRLLEFTYPMWVKYWWTDFPLCTNEKFKYVHIQLPVRHFNAHLLSCQMTNPAIQNDFSYYRRTLSRMRINNQAVSVSGSRSPCKFVSLSQGICFCNAPFPRVMGVKESTSVLWWSGSLGDSRANPDSDKCDASLSFHARHLLHFSCIYFVRLPSRSFMFWLTQSKRARLTLRWLSV